jgi:hypothetical protein
VKNTAVNEIRDGLIAGIESRRTTGKLLLRP